ncbi:MAG: hypothetical protein UHM23_00355 [Clostridia bacterium]|nr:hypothetical protein [Clostridia bacterium]
MFVRSKIACKKMLKHISTDTMLPVFNYKKYYKNKRQLYSAIYKGYLSLDADGRAVVGHTLGFCPHCMAEKQPYNYRTVAQAMRFYSAGEALDKFNEYINEIALFMEKERKANKDKAVKK